MKYLFGPINSRRLGISLGIDLVPPKTCTLDCVYCECGRTTNLTSKIKEYYPTSAIIQEIDNYLNSKPKLDVITLAGSGEPTLHQGIGQIINYLKTNHPSYKVALLTNGTLLYLNEVQNKIKLVDYLIPSLDAVSQNVFQKILRPAPGMESKKIINGLIDLQKKLAGQIILEIFIIPQINDKPQELKKLKEACRKIKPTKIQLNSLDRPGTEDWVKPENKKNLLKIKEYFLPLKVEIIGQPSPKNQSKTEQNSIETKISSILKRRPSTIDDLMANLNLRKIELIKIIQEMIAKDEIKTKKEERGTFYFYKNNN